MTDVVQPPKEQAPKDLIGFLDFYLVRKAPFQIPDGAKEWLVKYGPWIAIVLMVLSLPVLLLALGVSTVVGPFIGVDYATGVWFLTLGAIVGFGLTLAALPGLFARRMSGWRLLFYAQIVGVVARVLAGSIVTALVVAVLWLYVLFQIRPLYKA